MTGRKDSQQIRSTSSAPPRVSIGMPVFNGEAYLVPALDSVLAQTFTDFELIICDNASTDGTEAICRSYAERDGRIRYFRNEENIGAARNFNRTFELARGEYFKWLAHDDVLAPTYFQRCVETLDASSASTILCFPQRIIMTHDGQVLGPDLKRRWFEANWPFDRIGFVRSLFIPDRNIPELVFGMARTEVMRRTRLIGAFNFADLVLVTEFRRLGEFRHILEPLFFNRGHNETTDFKRARRTARGEANWYDPHRRRGMHMAEARLLWERIKGVRHTEGSRILRIWCYGWIVFAHALMRCMCRIAPRLESARDWMWRTWSACTLAVIGRPRGTLFVHRLWAMLAGVRHRNRQFVRLALSGNSKTSQAGLLTFVAKRFAKRRDADARRLLADWQNGSCELRRNAASAALGGLRVAVDLATDPESQPSYMPHPASGAGRTAS